MCAEAIHIQALSTEPVWQTQEDAFFWGVSNIARDMVL
jgi:hypothetical protein